MTNLQSIFGGAVWEFVSGLLLLAALEPVSVKADAPVQVASTQTAQHAA